MPTLTNYASSLFPKQGFRTAYSTDTKSNRGEAAGALGAGSCAETGAAN